MTSKQMTAEIFAFYKAQVSAFLGGLVDFSIMVLMVELGQCHYMTGIVTGGLIGAAVNFYFNRQWAFSAAKTEDWTTQVIKFVVMVAGSIMLKSIGTYLLADLIGMDYRIARLITDAIVCFGFNYLLMRLWVFNSESSQ